MITTVKLCYRGKNYRFPTELPVSGPALPVLINSLHENVDAEVDWAQSLYWKDEDGDLIVITNETSLREGLKAAQGGVFRIYDGGNNGGERNVDTYSTDLAEARKQSDVILAQLNALKASAASELNDIQNELNEAKQTKDAAARSNAQIRRELERAKCISAGLLAQLEALRMKAMQGVTDARINGNNAGQVTNHMPHTRSKGKATATYEIFVKSPNDRTHTFRVAPGDTVGSLKKKVDEKRICPYDSQRMIFAGKQMENDRTIADYGIGDHSTVHLVLRMKGC